MLPVYPSSDNIGVSFNTVYLVQHNFMREDNIEMGLIVPESQRAPEGSIGSQNKLIVTLKRNLY